MPDFAPIADKIRPIEIFPEVETMKMEKLLFFLAVALLVLPLGGCGLMQARLPTSTPTFTPTPTYTPTFTPVPTATPTPTLTPTPTPTSTPTPIPPQALFHQAIKLCETAFQSPVRGGSPGPGVLALVYKFEEKTWKIEDLPHGPEAAHEVRTIACIKEDREHVANYTPGDIPGYRLIWHVRLVNWPDGEVLAKRTLYGDKPPSVEVYVGKPPEAVYGAPPTIYFMEWLASFHIWQDVVIVPGYISMVFSPDSKTLVSLSKEGKLQFWQVDDCTLSRSWEILVGLIENAAFSPNLTIVAFSEFFPSISLHRVSNGQFLRSLDIPMGEMSDLAGPFPGSIAFSPDGALLAAGYDNNTVYLWQVSNGSLLHTFKGHRDRVNSVAFSPDGTILASGSDDIRLWNVSDGTLLRTLTGHIDEINALAFSPDGALLASASEDGSIRIWRVSDGTLLHKLVTYSSESMESVAFSPDGALLAAGTSLGDVMLWSVSDGKLLRVLRGHKGLVNKVDFSPDGTLLASGSYDGTVRFWRLDELNISIEWTTILSDSFDNNRNDWPTSLNEEDEYWFSLTRQLVEGTYRWEGKAKRDVISWVWPDIKNLTDFHLSVEIRQISGPSDAEAGLIFRLSDDDFYLFSIVPKLQKYGLWLSRGEEWKTLLDWTSSSVINSNGWNRIEVKGIGSVFTMWINGYRVASVSESSLAKGKVGLVMGIFKSGDEAAFEFDNFEVREPSVTLTHTPTPVRLLPSPTPTATPVPEAKKPLVLIRLSPGKFGKPLWLEVVSGNYELATGATLLPGSSVGVFEEWLTFSPGLAIEVVNGEITLKGKTYPPGTKLIVDSHGNLVPR